MRHDDANLALSVSSADSLIGLSVPQFAKPRLLSVFLDVHSTTAPWRWPRVTAFAGSADTANPARRTADLAGKPYWALAQGFISNATSSSMTPLSLVIDKRGIYYDARRPSDLEHLIVQHKTLRLGESPQASELMAAVVNRRISRYHTALHNLPTEMEPHKSRRRVLVVDQAVGDPSIAGGLADASHFQHMLEAALDENPGAEIWVAPPLLSPASSRGRRGILTPTDPPAGVRRLATMDNPYHLIEQVDRVYTVSAQLGFEALLAGRPVRVFGMPFYAGWGLTEDEQQLARRTARPSIAALFEAAYMRYPRYLNPATHRLGTLEDVLESLALQGEVQQRQARFGPLVGVGFSLWKHRFARPYLEAGGHPVTWSTAQQNVTGDRHVVVWGAAPRPQGLTADAPILRMEDAFIHSSGLGSDLMAPCSQVLDSRGLYFDAHSPNDLLDLLNHHVFDAKLIERAALLRKLVIKHGITKYNLGRRAPTWQAPQGRAIALVTGQVADDASVRYGSAQASTAEKLLSAVRLARPDAWVVYKPHPDVITGNRIGLLEASELCDVVDTQSDIISLIEAADEVHTITSLAGFDALIRNKKVYTYGLPFYAGWGLTIDEVTPIPGRERQLSLDELVAASLILYPIYWDWTLGIFTTPEAIVTKLGEVAARPMAPPLNRKTRELMHVLRWIRNLVEDIRVSRQPRF
jgi:capsular polysaccharide export protein